MLHNRLPYLIALLIHAIIITLYFWEFIVDANIIHFSLGGDGFKNFFTMAWYLKHDSGYWFTGMNYPFGENVIYTDNQPIISFLLQKIALIIPKIHDYLRAIITLCNVYSLAFAGVFTIAVLRIFNLPFTIAFFFSIPIMLLSPQVDRIGGHYALAYSCYLPMLFYFTLCILKGKKVLFNSIALTVVILFFCFTHLYYIGLAIFFIIPLLFTAIVFGKIKIKTDYTKIAALIFAVLVPFVLLKLFIFISDPIADRPQAPWGFVFTRTNFWGVFVHPLGLFSEFINIFKNWDPFIGLSGEGIVFIGTVPAFVVMLSPVYFLRERKIETHTLILISSIPVLLYAMAFPFFIPKFEPLFYKLPAGLKQMRASGRFAWIFYYSAVYFTAVYIYRFFRDKTFSKSWMLAVLVITWFIESSIINTNSRKDFKKFGARFDLKEETKELNQLISKYGKQASDFNGLLFLPFFLNGSEKLQFETPHLATAMQASLATDIPMISGAMSRTSLTQTLMIAVLMGDRFIPKPFLEYFDISKNFLAVTRNDMDLNEREKEIISKAKFIGTSSWFNLYDLPLSAFPYHKDTLLNLLLQHSDTSSESQAVAYRSFDELNSSVSFFGKGALESFSNPAFLFNDHISNSSDGDTYEFSVWTFADNTTTSMPALYISVVDEKANATIESHEFLAKHSGNIIESWVQVKGEFKLAKKDYKVNVVGYADKGIYDEMLIRKKGVNFTSSDLNRDYFKHLYNNYPVY